MAKPKRKTKKSSKKKPATRKASKKQASKKGKGRHAPNWDRCLVCHHPVMGSRKGMDTHMTRKHPGAQYGTF